MDFDVIVDLEVENPNSQDQDNENDNDDDDGCLLRISMMLIRRLVSHTQSTRSTLIIQTGVELFTSLNRILVCWCLRSGLKLSIG